MKKMADVTYRGRCGGQTGAFAPTEQWTIGGALLETNNEWTVARRYMSLETLARVTNIETLKLPGVAA